MPPTINIRNKRTGEQKTVPLSEAGQFGISASNAFDIFESQQKLGQVIETGELPEEVGTKTEKEKLFGISAEAAQRALTTLTTEDVKTGPITTRFQKLKEKFPGAEATAGTTFRSQLAFTRTIIRNALLGGQISPQEAASLESGLPTEFDQENIAEQKLRDFITQFGDVAEARKGVDEELKKKEVTEPLPQVGGLDVEQLALKATEVQPLTPVQEAQPMTPVQKVAQKAAGIAPVVGGIAGGIAGAALGGGIASLFTGALGTAAGTGAGIAFGETLQDLVGIQDETPEEQLKKGAVTTATAAGLDLLGAGFFMGGGAVVKALGKGIFKIGDDIALRAIRPSPSQQRKFLQKTGIEMKDFVIDKGLFSKGVEQVDNLIKPIQSSFDDIAIKSGKTVQLEDIVAKFDNQIDEFNAIPNAEAKRLASQLTKEKKLLIKSISGEKEFQIFGPGGKPIQVSPTGAIDVGELTKLRRTIDDLMPESKFLQDPIRAGKNKAVRNIYQASVQDATAGLTDATGRNLKEMGQELNKLYNFRGIAEQQAGLGKGTLPVGLIRSITTATGAGAGFAGGRDLESALTGALFGFGLPAVANNAKIISYLARNLPIVGKAVQALPENQKARVITDAFRRLLTNVMAVGMSNFGI